jgi:hypothetical protein
MLPVGIFGSFKQANKVIDDARREVAKGKKQKDEVAAKRQQKQGGGRSK